MSEDIFGEDLRDFKKKLKDFFSNISGFMSKDLSPDELGLDEDDAKSYSISYKYETGMNEPEFRIEGDIDVDSFSKFLRKLPEFYTERPERKEIELTPELKMEDTEAKIEENSKISVEPYADITEFREFVEVCVELPGVSRENIEIRFDSSGNELTIEANREDKNFYKEIMLPNGIDINDYKLDLKNGIACIKIKMQNPS